MLYYRHSIAKLFNEFQLSYTQQDFLHPPHFLFQVNNLSNKDH